MSVPSSNSTSSTPALSARPVRVCILQPLMPHYRVPVFDLLARQPGIELSIWSDHKPQGSMHPAAGTGNFETVHTPFKYVGPMYWQPMQVTAAKQAAAGKFDVVIYSWNSRLLHLRHALNICRRAGVPTLLWGHGIGVGGRDGPFRRWLRNSMIHKAAGCILYNHTVARKIESDGIERERIFVALNAFDQAPIRAARDQWLSRPDDLARFQSERGLNDHEVMMFVSRLEPAKRIDALIETFAQVRRERPKARLAIIGRGPEEAALRAKAAALGVAEHVIFVGPLYKEEELAPWFLSSACMPFTTNLGLSLLHAFGYGLPVITCDDPRQHGPEVEALVDGTNGLLYRTGDLGHFAQQITRCLGDEALRRRLSAGAFATVQSPDGVCIERMVRGFIEAIDFALRTRKPSRSAALDLSGS